MKNRNNVQFFEFVAAIVAVFLMILGAKSMATTVKTQLARGDVTIVTESPPAVDPTPGGELVISDQIYDLDCGDDGKVESAIMEVEISGEVPPYFIEFEPGDLIIPDIQNNSSVRFRMNGGSNLTVKVRSSAPDGKPMEKNVHAPSFAPDCEEQTPTDTATPTPTDTATPTPTSTATSRIPATATKTKPPAPEDTNTPVVTFTPTPTGTFTIEATSTPTGNATSTPTKAPTSTPTDIPTSTPTKAPTSTPTNIPTSTPTSTPTSPGNPSECVDGVDNDRDGYIDLLDSDCGGVHDNHEDR